MLRKRLLIIAVINILCCVNYLAQEKGADNQGFKSGIIYGKDHAFGLRAPKDWIMDNTSGVKQGLHAVFYPKGSSWGNGEVVMYANVNHKGEAKKDSFEKIVADDIAAYKTHSSNIKVMDADPLPTANGKNALVKYFSGDINGNYEAVAYVDEEKFIVILVLTSKTKSGFESSLPAFKELVASYLFITDKVTY